MTSMFRTKKSEDHAEISKVSATKSSSAKTPKTSSGEKPKRKKEVDEDKSCDIDDMTSVHSGEMGWKERGDCQRKVVYNQFGDFPKEVLEVTFEKKPSVENPTDVVIKVEASTVSLNDCVLRRGICFQIFNPVCLPATPGYDAIGTIVEMGEEVTEWKKGDRVAVLIRTGGNARYAVVSSEQLIHVPKSLDAAEAVCMVTIYMTAYQALKQTLDTKERALAKPMADKKVLVVGGVGPIGQALIQLAVKGGATEVSATGPKHRHKYIKSTLGAKPLPYEPEEWLPEVKGEMDLVFDGVCQDGYESSRAALKDDGKLVTVGMYSLLHREQPGFLGAPLSAFMTDAKASLFMHNTSSYEAWTSYTNDPETYKADMEKLFNKLKKKQIRPLIAKRVGLSEVADAHLYLERGKARGPIVCMPWRRAGMRLIKEMERELATAKEANDTPPKKEQKQKREEPKAEQRDPEETPKREEPSKKEEPKKKRGLFGRRDKAEKTDKKEQKKGKKQKDKKT